MTSGALPNRMDLLNIFAIICVVSADIFLKSQVGIGQPSRHRSFGRACINFIILITFVIWN